MKKFFKDYFVGVLVGITMLIIPSIWALINFESFKKCGIFIWKNIFNFKIPIWIILVAILILFLVSYFYRKIKRNRLPQEPDYLQYKEDVIKGVRCMWDYIKVNNEYFISNLCIFCPKCDTMMKYTNRYYMGYTHECSNCNNKVNVYLEDIKILIVSNIKNNIYRDKINNKI